MPNRNGELVLGGGNFGGGSRFTGFVQILEHGNESLMFRLNDTNQPIGSRDRAPICRKGRPIPQQEEQKWKDVGHERNLGKSHEEYRRSQWGRALPLFHVGLSIPVASDYRRSLSG